ncbi:MAG: Fe-S cluster assembly ATPase SufC [Myxococcales bacterium]|nr:Fe-S cluster assembly ATPase SufC [Myxococcales bacterium]
MNLVEIEDLHVTVGETPIIAGLNLTIPAGEIHAVMGPNGAGKSTLSYAVAGREGYTVTQGDIRLGGESLLELGPDERARRGVFLAFQYPVEVPGVRSKPFLRAAVNAVRKARGQAELDPGAFLKFLRATLESVRMDEAFTNRDLNSGFSGGEKKRFDILQMALLEPRFCILDETDSGLDIDAMRIVAEGVNALRSPERSMLVITHYQRLLDYIVPDVVHVLKDGRIMRSGDKGLVAELEARGYDWVSSP